MVVVPANYLFIVESQIAERASARRLAGALPCGTVDGSEENRLFLDDAAGAGRARGSLGTAGAALTQHTRPVLKS